MKPGALAIILLAASCATAPAASEFNGETAALDAESTASSQLRVYVGVRSFDVSDWSPVEEQGTVGLEYVHEAPGSVVGLEIAAFASERTEDDFGISPTTQVDMRGRTGELDFGVHKAISTEYAGVHPYFGGGLSLLHAEFRGESGGSPADDEDNSAGLYIHGGVDFDLGPNFFLGLDLRLRGGTKVDLLGDDLSSGYGQVGVVLGVRF